MNKFLSSHSGYCYLGSDLGSLDNYCLLDEKEI